MEWVTALDTTDRNILRILSLYVGLGPLELWYELGEFSNQMERVTQEEILHRLDFLFSQGFVEKIWGPSGTEQLRYRLKRDIGDTHEEK